jgi:hypothetical protein
MWLLCFILNHLGSLLSFTPGRGIVYDFGFCTVGYGGYYAKMLALALVAITWLCIFTNIILVFGKNTKVIPMRVLEIITGQ